MKPLILGFFLISGLISYSQTHDNQEFGRNNYTEYREGNLPIIISAPHGGGLKPEEIPDRDCEGCVYIRDSYTKEVSELLDSALFDLTGCAPHVIINHLHRSKMDANREIIEAADGNEHAETAWTEYQAYIERAKAKVIEQHGKGLFIDMHGHGHTIQRLELGYRISASELRYSDNQLDALAPQSSIARLTSKNFGQEKFSALLRGSKSLGAYFENQGIPAVPSPTYPYPNEGESYFRGGYNTQTHGSSSGGTIDAFQVECNMTGIRDNDANRRAFATEMATVVQQYLIQHTFGNDDNLTFCYNVTTNNNVSQFSPNDYIELFQGDIPLLLTVSPGGNLAPNEIPDRDCDGCSTQKTDRVIEIAEAVKNEVYSLTGCYPSVVINHLHRAKLDANREAIEAADENPDAELAWKYFHHYVSSVKNALTQQYSQALVIDITGNSHVAELVELGYLLSSDDLRKSDSEINALPPSSSIQYLASNNQTGSSLAELIRGNQSLGTLLEAQSYSSIPSAQTPSPSENQGYFRGGYITERYGSLESGTVNSLQLAVPYNGIRDADINSITFGKALASVLLDYMGIHYYEQSVATTAGCITTSTSPVLASHLAPVAIYDLSGKKVFQQVDKLPNGIYIFQYITDGLVVHRKVLKMN